MSEQQSPGPVQSGVERIDIPTFHARLKAQGVSSREDIALVCPMCGTVQSARDLIEAGAGATFEDVEPYIGFSCVGRFTGAGPATDSEKRRNGCDWTLGGFFQLHELEVIDDDGKAHPRFRVATPEQAQAHAAARIPDATPCV